MIALPFCNGILCVPNEYLYYLGLDIQNVVKYTGDIPTVLISPVNVGALVSDSALVETRTIFPQRSQ